MTEAVERLNIDEDQVLGFSSKTGEGREELLTALDDLIGVDENGTVSANVSGTRAVVGAVLVILSGCGGTGTGQPPAPTGPRRRGCARPTWIWHPYPGPVHARVRERRPPDPGHPTGRIRHSTGGSRHVSAADWHLGVGRCVLTGPGSGGKPPLPRVDVQSNPNGHVRAGEPPYRERWTQVPSHSHPGDHAWLGRTTPSATGDSTCGLRLRSGHRAGDRPDSRIRGRQQYVLAEHTQSARGGAGSRASSGRSRRGIGILGGSRTSSIPH